MQLMLNNSVAFADSHKSPVARKNALAERQLWPIWGAETANGFIVSNTWT